MDYKKNGEVCSIAKYAWLYTRWASIRNEEQNGEIRTYSKKSIAKLLANVYIFTTTTSMLSVGKKCWLIRCKKAA